MKTAKIWFRVLVDDKGKAVDCKPVGGEGSEELGVFYVLAETAKEAARIAGNAQARKLLAARRARYDAEGRCRCGGKRDRPGFSTCARCSKRHQLYEDRRALRAKGIEVPKPDRREVILERKQQEADGVRLETLIDVQRSYRKMRGQGATFERWLAKRIEGLVGKAVA